VLDPLFADSHELKNAIVLFHCHNTWCMGGSRLMSLLDRTPTDTDEEWPETRNTMIVFDEDMPEYRKPWPWGSKETEHGFIAPGE
jgi:hypothetical protein